MNATGYRIADEPLPGPLTRLVVQPFWPFLSAMLAGSIIGFGWLIFNAFALGSPTRWRETLVCVIGLVGSALLVFAINAGGPAAAEAGFPAEYLVLLPIGFKLVCLYLALIWQSRSMELFEYYGGEPQNGSIPLLAAMFVAKPALIAALPPVWQAVFV